MESYERNIKLYIVWKATRSSLLWIPVFTLFYLTFGLTYTQIMILPVIVGTVQILLEVPSGVFADLVGGPITASWGFAATLIIVLGISALTTFLPIFMKEPPHHRESADRHFFSHLKEGMRFTARHPRVRGLTIYIGISTALLVMSFRLLQLVLAGAEIPVAWFGPIYALLIFISALVAWNASAIEEAIGERASLVLIPLVLKNTSRP